MRTGSRLRWVARGPTPGRSRARPATRSSRAATSLFAEQGFAKTTMAQIAEAAGLRQSSLYYYFRRKELILDATFTVNRAPIEFLKRIAPSPARRPCASTGWCGSTPCSCAWRRATSTRCGASRSCSPSCSASSGPIAASCTAGWSCSCAHGVDEGSFLDVDPRLTALSLLSANEGSQNW